MEQTSYQRLEAFWLAKGLRNMSAFAAAVKLKPGTLSAIKQRASKPTAAVLETIQHAFPDLSTEFILWGRGPMLKDGRALVPAGPSDEPPPTLPAAPAAAPYAAATYSGDVLDRLLSQINSQAQQHREELASLKREHRAATNAQARTAQYNMDAMHAKVHFLEGRLGLRPFTAEELAQAAQLAAATPPAKKIGLKHYDESAPTGRYGRHLSMAGVRIGEMSTALAA